ncbi:MAG: hypothetical protein LC802_17405 [Acidobacteria bacterium]|nr:hypothetical protein [Acidobacteriota bacterium]
MRNKRLLVVLVGAVVFGLVAAVSVSRYLSNAHATTRNSSTVVPPAGCNGGRSDRHHPP